MARTTSTDEELVAASRSGDSSALGLLYDRYFDQLYRFVYRHVNHVHDAEDLTSEVMTRMVSNLKSFERTSSFKTWLFGIARHAIADFWRTKYQLREQLVAEFAGSAAVPISEAHQGEVEELEEKLLDSQRERAQAVFEKLSDQYRTVLQLRFLEQRTVKETAEAMQTTPGNVKVLQYRALKKAAALAQQTV